MKRIFFTCRVNLRLIIVFTAIAFVLPSNALAGPSIDQVKKNVENLWKPIKESQPHVTAKEFKKIMDRGEKYILVDVRRKAEYEAAHLPGAIHIDRGVLEWVAPEKLTDTDATIYIYCRTGARGAFATQRLIEVGYKNAVNIYDAFKGWVFEGYPVYNTHGEFTLTPGAFEKKE